MSIDWSHMWVPGGNVLDIVLRGTVVYLVLFFYFRLLRREAGNLGMADMLFVVLIADAVQNAMANEYRSVTEGLVLVGTLAFWDVLLNWLAFRFPAIEKIIQPPPLLLVRDGRVQHRNLRREMISREELDGQLRAQGVSSLDQVRLCYLESDGQFSVIRRKDGPARGKPKTEAAGSA